MASLEHTQKYAHLNQLSTPQLEEILRADMALPGNDGGEMALYVMEIIEQREGGKSPENLAGSERAREEFDRLYNTPEGVGQSLYSSEGRPAGGTPEASGEASGPKEAARRPAGASRGLRRARRAGLIAAAALAALLGVMAAAQAAGLGAFGHWNDEAFSLGTIRYIGGTEETYDTESPPPSNDETEKEGTEWASIQDALDAHGITEVAAPTWIPEGFSFDGVDIVYEPDDIFWILLAGYLNEGCAINIEIESYDGEPKTQIMKTDAPVETFEVNDTTVYLIENTNSYTVTWATEHYAYYIDGNKKKVGKSELRQVAQSAIENVKKTPR